MKRIRWRAAVVGTLVVAAVGVGAAAAPNALAKAPTEASGPADPVLVWSGYAEQAVVTGRPPSSSAVLLGIVHIGMYDTAVALGLDAEAYLYREGAPPETSGAAAIGTVAHRILVARIPARRAILDAQYDQFLAGVRDGAGQAGRRGAWRADRRRGAALARG